MCVRTNGILVLEKSIILVRMFIAINNNFLKINLFIYLFLATWGLHCCAQAFSSCGERELLFVAVRGLLIAVASRCVARALGTWASVVVACGL